MPANHTYVKFYVCRRHVAGISRTFYLSTETISRPLQPRETIPLKSVLTTVKLGRRLGATRKSVQQTGTPLNY
jgi:hypothetical protein